MKCPICNNEIEDYSVDGESGHVHEETAHCSDSKHYYDYHFAYGSSEETIGDIVIRSHYTDNMKEREDKRGIIDLAIEIEKERYNERTRSD